MITLRQVNFAYSESKHYTQKTLYFSYLRGYRLANTYLLGYLMNPKAKTLMVPLPGKEPRFLAHSP